MCSQLITSTDKEIYNRVAHLLGSASEDILIICPYINTGLLHSILPDTHAKISIITSWKIHDIWFGSSDLALYEYTKDKSIRLYINNRVHLKLFMADWDQVIMGSANLTLNGLAMSSSYNFELDSIHENIDVHAKLYFKEILSNSVLVNDRIYEEYLRAVEVLPPAPCVEEPKIDESYANDGFLISSLPMSKNVGTLFNLYSDKYNSDDKESIDCALHDVALYSIPPGLSRDDFMRHIKTEFFKSVFIHKFLDNINNEGQFFGSVKEWIQKNCTDVPIPSRRDLTGNIQVLYKWIVELSDGKYMVDRPNYSERLYKR